MKFKTVKLSEQDCFGRYIEKEFDLITGIEILLVNDKIKQDLYENELLDE